MCGDTRKPSQSKEGAHGKRLVKYKSHALQLGCKDEPFDEFYAQLNDIVNSIFNLSERIHGYRIVWKVMIRSLLERFKLKAIATEESKGLDSLRI